MFGNMITVLRCIFLAILTLSIAAPSSFAEVVSGTAMVEIRQVLLIAETNSLNFGVISADGADVITMLPSGNVSSQNGSEIDGGTNPGGFAASGTPNAAVTISFANGTLSGPGTPMTLDTLTHNGGASPSFSNDGTLSFAVGANLSINDAQPSGLYSGTYAVAVDYQ